MQSGILTHVSPILIGATSPVRYLKFKTQLNIRGDFVHILRVKDNPSPTNISSFLSPLTDSHTMSLT